MHNNGRTAVGNCALCRSVCAEWVCGCVAGLSTGTIQMLFQSVAVTNLTVDYNVRNCFLGIKTRKKLWITYWRLFKHNSNKSQITVWRILSQPYKFDSFIRNSTKSVWYYFSLQKLIFKAHLLVQSSLFYCCWLNAGLEYLLTN